MGGTKGVGADGGAGRSRARAAARRRAWASFRAAVRRVTAAMRRRVVRRFDLGARGERASARWLRRRGYHLLARNLRLAGAEADLVALTPERDTLVIVEVKTVTGSFTHPAERVDARKRRRLARLGAAVVSRREHRGRTLRFDVIAVWPRGWGGWRLAIEHRPGAFEVGG